MTFIELPCLGNRDPHKFGLFQNMPQGANGTLKERSKGNISLNSFLLDQLSGLGNFLVSLRTQRTIIPSGELVFKIPGRFSVSDQHQSVLVSNLLTDDNAVAITNSIEIQKWMRNLDSTS